MTSAEWHEVLLVCLKSVGGIAVALVVSPVWAPITSRWVLAMIEKWSAKSKEHIEIAAQEFDKRIADLEAIATQLKAITATHANRMDKNDISNMQLGNKLETTAVSIGSSVTNLVERVEKDEGDIKIIDANVRNILGKIILKP